ncbi:hypothetical protein [Nocardia sp. NPDC004604]|uniref:hypothetical protein n=1 Tax=Nocardia sp. NPDC004604 TaxID=3157013 RepID=UPI0033BD6ABD
MLFVDDGQILTSAGLAAGLDRCVPIVRRDHGAAVANALARLAVVAPIRPGGQAQFIETPLPPETVAALAETRSWALERLDEPLTLRELAAHVSTRTPTRRFRAETGSSPLQWLLHQRIDRARDLLAGSPHGRPEITLASSPIVHTGTNSILALATINSHDGWIATGTHRAHLASTID